MSHTEVGVDCCLQAPQVMDGRAKAKPVLNLGAKYGPDMVADEAALRHLLNSRYVSNLPPCPA